MSYGGARLHAPVARILRCRTPTDRVTGVELESGERLAADGFAQATAHRLPGDPVPTYAFTPSALDDTLAPAGRHTVYLACPCAPFRLSGGWLRHKEAFADRMVASVEARAPGFAATVVGRAIHTQSAAWSSPGLERHPSAELRAYRDAPRPGRSCARPGDARVRWSQRLSAAVRDPASSAPAAPGKAGLGTPSVSTRASTASARPAIEASPCPRPGGRTPPASPRSKHGCHLPVRLCAGHAGSRPPDRQPGARGAGPWSTPRHPQST